MRLCNIASASGLPWPLPADLDEFALKRRLYPATERVAEEIPDAETLRTECARPGVTRQLLWEEYRATCPNGVSRSAFYRHCRQLESTQPVLKNDFQGGDYLFVDYSGDRLTYRDPATGVVVPVESAVCAVQRRILAPLRNQTFFSLAEINAAIAPYLDALNDRPMREYNGQSRRERFLRYDLPAARPLPAAPFSVSDARYGIRVPASYQVKYEQHYYSVPHELIDHHVDLFLAGDVLEIYSTCSESHLEVIPKVAEGKRRTTYVTLPSIASPV